MVTHHMTRECCGFLRFTATQLRGVGCKAGELHFANRVIWRASKYERTWRRRCWTLWGKLSYTAYSRTGFGTPNCHTKPLGGSFSSRRLVMRPHYHYSVRELHCAGYTCGELSRFGCSASDLRKAGFIANELCKNGFTAMQLRIGGFSAFELRGAQFTAKELRSVGFTVVELHEGGWSGMQLLAICFSPEQLSSVGEILTIYADFSESNATVSFHGISGIEVLAVNICPDANLCELMDLIEKEFGTVGLLMLPDGRILLPADMFVALEQLLLARS